MTQPSRAVTRRDYCQYLLGSQINYTLTNFANHSESFSHDAINRYLLNDRIEPRQLWQQVSAELAVSPNAFLLFDDQT